MKVTQLGKQQNKTPEYLKINPFGKVPAMQFENANAFESTAILRFMANKFPVEDHWYPKDPVKRLKVDMYLGKTTKKLLCFKKVIGKTKQTKQSIS